VLIAAERLLPWRALAATGVAALLVVIAIGVAAAPNRVPMLTIPHSGPAMTAPGMVGRIGPVQAASAVGDGARTLLPAAWTDFRSRRSLTARWSQV
jgi:hypothetical protein